MYKLQQFAKFQGIVHGFSTKDDGNMASLFGGIKANKKDVVKNQRKFLKKLNINPEKCVKLWLQNEDEIIIVDNNYLSSNLSEDFTPKADALITKIKETYLFMVVADCVPVIIYDPVKEALALVHAGWKGVDLDIVQQVIKRLSDLYDIDRSDLVVGIGPAARKDSYIKKAPKQIRDPKWSDFVQRVSEDKYEVDFVSLLKKQLIEAGVLGKSIFDCGIDTIKDERFYSYFRESELLESDQGRFAVVVGIKK